MTGAMNDESIIHPPLMFHIFTFKRNSSKMTRTARRHSIVFFHILALLFILSESRKAVTFITRPNLRVLKSSSWALGQQENSLPGLILLRGGDLELSKDEEDGIVLTKTQNIIRGILKISDKKAPTVSKIMRTSLGIVETITGFRLLPTKKKSKKKGGESKKSATEESESENTTSKVEEEETKPQKSSKKAGNSKLKKPSAATKKHMTSNIKSTNANYRIQRELKEFIKSPPPNLSIQVGSNIRIWIISMAGANNTIYEGEVFKLRVSFPAQYPTVPPSVYFLQGHIPVHEHVYTNGDICLSLLGKDWRPTMTAQSIAVSILSILSSAQSKSLPMDNARHAGNKPGQYQKDWVYHDDNC
jgi:ubiquitin-conjugating enzyme E2 W